LVIIVPGLLNCIDDHYVHTLIDILEEYDYEWKMINYRGFGAKLTTGKPYDTTDFQSFKEPLSSMI
jgi:predicted alpha/beta-fold hydrolase